MRNYGGCGLIQGARDAYREFLNLCQLLVQGLVPGTGQTFRGSCATILLVKLMC